MSERSIAVRPCSMPGCGRPHRARGLCHKHWKHEKYHGRLADRPLQERRRLTVNTLREYVEVGHADCWLWHFAKNRRGYAIVGYNAGGLMAHRVVYELLVGPIPEGLTLDHLCRVRHCVNPDHLEPVTHAENMRRSPLLRPTHCKRGHRRPEDRSRRCASCKRERRLERLALAAELLPNTAA